MSRIHKSQEDVAVTVIDQGRLEAAYNWVKDAADEFDEKDQAGRELLEFLGAIADSLYHYGLVILK